MLGLLQHAHCLEFTAISIKTPDRDIMTLGHESSMVQGLGLASQQNSMWSGGWDFIYFFLFLHWFEMTIPGNHSN